MRGLWRPLAFAAAITLTVAAGVPMAQTVTVIKVSPGAPVELALNTATIATTTAAGGIATLDVNLSAHRNKKEIDANIFVDTCGDLRRILLVEPGVQGMPVPTECIRQEISGVYIVRDVTSFVIDVSGALPSVRFRQGPAPEAWLNPQAAQSGDSGREWGPLPTGLIAFGGGGLSMFGNQVFVACGNVTDCSGKDNRLAYTGGVDIWFAPFFAAEISYLKPADVTVKGTGDGYSFDNYLDTQILTAAGKVGFPVGPVRLYGKGGGTYYRAESVTTQTMDAYTVMVNDVERTIPGGTQTFGLKVTGWRYFFGGGAEIWMSKRIGVYGEFVYIPLKGDATGGGEGYLDETVSSVLGGIRVRIGR